MLVIKADIFFGERLQYQYYHICFSQSSIFFYFIVMNRRKYNFCFLIAKIVWMYVSRIFQRFHQREWCVEQDCCFLWSIGVLQSIGNSDRSRVFSKTTANTDYYKIHRNQHQCCFYEIVQPCFVWSLYFPFFARTHDK